MTVAEAFKRFRKEFNLTQAEVAETLGIKATSYEYEKNDKPANPTAKTLLKLTSKYHVTADYLLGLTDEPFPVQSDKVIKQLAESLARIEKTLEELKSKS